MTKKFREEVCGRTTLNTHRLKIVSLVNAHQRAFTAKDTLTNEGDKMTCSVDVSSLFLQLPQDLLSGHLVGLEGSWFSDMDFLLTRSSSDSPILSL